jgi:hypothetical protein
MRESGVHDYILIPTVVLLRRLRRTQQHQNLHRFFQPAMVMATKALPQCGFGSEDLTDRPALVDILVYLGSQENDYIGVFNLQLCKSCMIISYILTLTFKKLSLLKTA